MLKHLSFSLVVLALIWASAPSAEAALITGDMSISGGMVPVNGTSVSTNLGTATGIDFLVLDGSAATPGIAGDFVVNSASGNFSSLQGSVGSIKDFSFAGTGSANYPLAPISSFELIGSSFGFDLSTVSVLYQSGQLLNLAGTGVFHLTGFDNTSGTYVFSGNQSGTTFSFSASEGTVGINPLGEVPEPSSMMMLGTGLIGLAAATRRRFGARNA